MAVVGGLRPPLSLCGLGYARAFFVDEAIDAQLPGESTEKMLGTCPQLEVTIPIPGKCVQITDYFWTFVHKERRVTYRAVTGIATKLGLKALPALMA